MRSVQGSGSFIRPNAKGLEFGTSFVKAIRNKYIISREEKEDQKDDSSQFYKSNGNFEIEVILKPQKGKRRELKELKEIGLEGDGVSTAGTEEELEQLALELLSKFINYFGIQERVLKWNIDIHVLNLSFSLLSAWSEILAIVRSLKVSLRTLSISLVFRLVASERF